MNESQTRLDKIDPKLKEAGWSIMEDSHILTEYVISNGRISAVEKGTLLKVDYILSFKGSKLAIIEAKSDEKEVSEGVMQAKLYAGKLQIRFAYATNGNKIYEIDMLSGEEGLVDSFPTPESLWLRTYGDVDVWRDAFNATPFFSNSEKKPRFYQELAVNRVMDAIATGRNRILLTLATGTGKTFIAFQIAWKLFQSKWNLSKNGMRPKILFLADRNILADQAFNGFGGFEEDALVRIKPSEISKKGKVPTNGSVFFTIFQTFDSGADEPNFGQYPPDFFDFIVIDECHRGGANDESNWRRIMDYFAPAVQLGLTATPRRDVNADTYRYFGEPVYTYSLKEGIEDGFLTPFRHVKIQGSLDDYVYEPTDHFVCGEADEIEEARRGKTYTETDFYQGKIEIQQRDESRVKELLKLISEQEKTLVFCYTQNHAGHIRDMFNRFSKVKNTYYCVRVTSNDGAQGETYLKQFQDNEKIIPTVLTTSQKLSTGVDALNIRNIVLMRPINSMVEFKQIIGRGTRPFDGKYFFTVYDFVKAYEKFKDPSWDGDPVCAKCGNDPCTCQPTTRPPKPGICAKCGTDPCSCSPSGPRICSKCGTDPCTCPPPERKEKLVITLSDGRARSIKHLHSIMFWGPDGIPVSPEEFIETLFGKLPEFYKDEHDLREQWTSPITRKALLNKLAEAGYNAEVLGNIQTLLDAEECDLLDVLEYISYAKSMMQREERVAKAMPHLSEFTPEQNRFLDFILKQYVQHGVNELSIDRLPGLINIKYGTAVEGIKRLGGDVQSVQRTFSGFQRYLYL